MTRLITWLLVAFLSLAALIAAVSPFSSDLFAAELQGQSTATQIQNKIDESVWRAFKNAFETLDGPALNALYADDVLRVTPAGIDTEGLFKAYNANRFASNLESGDQIRLDFWFDDRKTNETTSYEVGFFRISERSNTGSTSQFYGQFHIVLKKLDGQWKIVQDWDTDTIGGSPISAEDFLQREPVRFR